jgi:PEP-CTERM motif
MARRSHSVNLPLRIQRSRKTRTGSPRTFWLTRADTQGPFNIRSEPAYTHNLSPSGTEWAFGTAADFATLTYTTWEMWAANNPPATVGRDAVVHLISDDIYLDVKFTSWTNSGGGGFSYVRSTAPVPEPGSFALLGTAALVTLARRPRC